MKSVNVKRIAAAAAGAAMLGAAFAGAVAVDQSGVSGFQWFSNGSPNEVLVVGSKAQPSDAVAAATVAAMIGNLAYTSGAAVTITGTDLLTCSGGSAGNGTGKVTLQVTTPGVNPNLAFQIKTYVNDNLDDQSDNTRSLTTNLMSTFSSSSVTNVTVSGNPKTVTKDNTPILSMSDSGVISNPKGLTIKEDQRVYVSSKTVYDTSSHKLEAQNVRTAYEASFADPIPVCMDTTKTQAGCSTSDLVTKNRVKITFLGDKWVLTPSSSGSATWGVTSGTTTVAGSISTIGLGKEVDYKSFMVAGDSTTLTDGKKVVLHDITGIGTGSNTQTRATFQVFDATGALIDQTTLYPLETYDKNGVTIFVWDVVGGALGGTNYAEVSLFGSRLILDDGKKISNNGDWIAEIQSQNVSTSEGLQKVVLMDTTSINNMFSGDSVQLIKNIPGLQLTFNGLDLTSDDYDALTFSAQKNATISLASGRTLSGDFMQVSSQKSNAFFQTGMTDTSGVSNVYVLLNPLSTSSDSVYSYLSGTVFYSNSSSLYVAASGGNGTNLYLNATAAAAVRTSTLTYYYSSTETSTIRFADDVNASQGMNIANGINATTPNTFVITVPEGTEDSITTSSVGTVTTGQPYWNFLYDQDLRQFVSTIGTSTIGTNPFGYEANDAAAATGDGILGFFWGNFTTPAHANMEANYVSYRGSTAASFGTGSVSVNYAKKIGHGSYVLSKAGSGAGTNTNTNDYSAGDVALDDSGYKVTVTKIGASSSGSGSVGGSDQLKVMANGQEISSVDAVVPIDTGSKPLVVLDTNPLAGSAASVITFGGQMVNSVSASALAGAELTQGSEPIVKVVGSKIVVAGYDAAGTMEAANTLVGWLAQNRDKVRG